MSNELGFRVTKTEYEQIVIGMVIANYMQAFSGVTKEREDYFLKGILAIGMVNDLDKIITRNEEGDLTVTERVMKKIEKIVEDYKKSLIESN